MYSLHAGLLSRTKMAGKGGSDRFNAKLHNARQSLDAMFLAWL